MELKQDILNKIRDAHELVRQARADIKQDRIYESEYPIAPKPHSFHAKSDVHETLGNVLQILGEVYGEISLGQTEKRKIDKDGL